MVAAVAGNPGQDRSAHCCFVARRLGPRASLIVVLARVVGLARAGLILHDAAHGPAMVGLPRRSQVLTCEVLAFVVHPKRGRVVAIGSALPVRCVRRFSPSEGVDLSALRSVVGGCVVVPFASRRSGSTRPCAPRSIRYREGRRGAAANSST